MSDFNLDNNNNDRNNDPYSMPDNSAKTNTADNKNYTVQNNSYNDPNFDPYRQGYGYDPNMYYGAAAMGQYPTGLATASMIIGIISILGVLLMISFPPLLILPVLGIVFGAMYKSKKYPVARGRSTAGIVMSVVSLVMVVALFVIAVYAMMTIMQDSEQMNEMMQLIKQYYPDIYEQYYEMFGEQYPEWFTAALQMFKF